MINPNQPIQIRQVANGFIVEPPMSWRGDKVICDEDIHVFRSYTELEDFMAGHFSHRDSKLKSDKEEPQQ